MNDQTPRAVEATKQRIARALKEMQALHNDDRLEVMAYFCRSCGCDDPRCQCWNDE